MAYYAGGDEQYQELQEIPIEQQMEERLVEALGYHVQDSVNLALIQALKPFTKPLINFGSREFLGEGSQQRRAHAGDSGGSSGLSLQRAGGSSSAEILAQMAASVLRDHEYRASPPLKMLLSTRPRQALRYLHLPSQSLKTRKRSPFRVRSYGNHVIPRLT
ncbi:hypothetical protein NDU88_003760 [Pleurodeles waltl]|uniref:Uncharacterized protein n=1 Tax=Pleurodeles waltl TaxID=8319 RepID=A0AAV7T607_PLEWA|nr:hypothetical protein NDU88_003760 [Pleurodeles waltl]